MSSNTYFNGFDTYSTVFAAVKAFREQEGDDYENSALELHAFAVKPRADSAFDECTLHYVITYGDCAGAGQGVGEEFLKELEGPRGDWWLEPWHYEAVICDENTGRYELAEQFDYKP